MAALEKQVRETVRRYTYADYLEWDDDERWELLDGIPYAMAAPLISHQSVAGGIFLQIALFLRGKKCKVFFAPTDVRLNPDFLDNTVVQPDVLVVCDEKKIEDNKAVRGAPDMVVEVLSPSTAYHDTMRKYRLYLKAGVREYWIADPESKTVLVHILTDGESSSRTYGETDKVPVTVLDGCVVELAEVFA